MNNNGVNEISLSARARWSFLSTFIKSLLVLVVLGRLLAPINFGLLGIAWIFVALGVRFGQAGIGPAVVQQVSEIPGAVQFVRMRYYTYKVYRDTQGLSWVKSLNLLFRDFMNSL